MSNNIGDLTTDWLISKASETSTDNVTLLIQGYPGSGFARIVNGKLELKLEPEETMDDPLAIVWSRYFDIRMFGDRGEWHLWQSNSGWNGRFRGVEEWPKTNRMDRDFALWGTLIEGPVQGWWRCSEERGPVVWLPEFALAGPGKNGRQQSGVLKIRQQVEFDDAGIAGIVDAMIMGFEVQK
jgi:CRISPR-associated protein (TIGR03984 family)